MSTGFPDVQGIVRDKNDLLNEACGQLSHSTRPADPRATMAEAIGLAASAITLAGLFKLSLEAFELVQTAHNADADFKKLLVKLNIERCRLYIWGQAVGLTSDDTVRGKIDELPFSDVIRECLDLILQLFLNSKRLEGKYGCQPSAPTSRSAQELQHLQTNFQDLVLVSNKPSATSKLRSKARWAVHDRSKFSKLILEAKGLIDGLQDITTAYVSQVSQERLICAHIDRINDSKTLDLVAEVCESDYPSLSEAATTKAETLSTPNTLCRDIERWKDTVHDADDEYGSAVVNATIANVENWTVAELKHNYIAQFLVERSDSMEREPKLGGAERPFVQSIRDRERFSQASSSTRTTGNDDTVRSRQIGASGSSFTTYRKLWNGMTRACNDKGFMDELGAINNWFSVLSDHERAAAYLSLGQSLNAEYLQVFAGVAWDHASANRHLAKTWNLDNFIQGQKPTPSAMEDMRKLETDLKSSDDISALHNFRAFAEKEMVILLHSVSDESRTTKSKVPECMDRPSTLRQMQGLSLGETSPTKSSHGLQAKLPASKLDDDADSRTRLEDSFRAVHTDNNS